MDVTNKLTNMKKPVDYFNYLYGLERTGMKYDLKNIQKLLEHIGNPQEGIDFIHIAGTNGKGATASFIASILAERKLRTGLYTSPHILKFNERIRINGKKIPNKYIFDFINKNKKFIDKLKPSFFEVTTAVAFQYFKEQKVDIAVIEAGLGGRLDSTNIVKPKLSIITQIAMDHMQYLGNTLHAIAKEKLGIVKPDIDVIVSDNNEKLKLLFRKSIKKEHLFYLDDHADIKESGKSGISLKIKYLNKTYSLKYSSPIPGKYQFRNAAAAVLAVLMYTTGKRLFITPKLIAKGITNVKENTGYRGRLEVIKEKDRTYIFDISHNPAGIKEALNNLPVKNIDVVLFGMMADKDYKSSVDEILRYSKNIIFTRPNYTRALEPTVLYEYAKAKNTNNNLFNIRLLSNAAKQAEIIAGKRGCIMVIGSFFLVSGALRIFKLQKHFT
ncbi:MAG: bifunctional folylpolyglutamate synthase/dihydrofolate synthase [Ignavibacteriae bacterium]|nr:MAG: bifunctional folylpolyglutamate synthase/dihydrofolate synthase [Ignavibacteriota bacterium]